VELVGGGGGRMLVVCLGWWFFYVSFNGLVRRGGFWGCFGMGELNVV